LSSVPPPALIPEVFQVAVFTNAAERKFSQAGAEGTIFGDS
jgi:hypothetical protein